MSQNIYDDPDFFAGYATLPRSVEGLSGAPEWDAIQRLLPDLNGKSIIDLGCGYGWFCRWASAQGATQVTGVDLSEKMLTKAISMTDDSAITYLRADMEKLSLPTEQYDLIYSSLALHYVVDIYSLLTKLYQALNQGGRVIFSAEHPIYTAPLIQEWCIDKYGNKAWPVNQYQQEGNRISHWFADGVVKQHRKLSTWINLLISAGFEIIELDEWGPSCEQIIENPTLDEEKERPMIFIISAQKP
ncbi:MULTISPECIES: class I SAM-dependent methyltransferase [Providencia]|uniref:SAM-dependent methyltransferase n=2 Tax=Providencia TaxID=586 RepID=A0A264VPX5_PRORE|nr:MULTISPECIES: class I SAM-dependent methyltransferase [Providencia]MBN6366147.1 class I SAM-dependent methyltransferase [Providencia rettgeri]OZS73416.1 SAM-dependent methyltransferase [Providencia rettgeri]WNK25891.1 class I SAM-dependent methyltransferase [Providencia hangzhouensis]